MVEFAPPDIDDRSQYVDASVADTIDGMMPQLIDVFVSDDRAVECVAKKPGPDAETIARQATGYLNHLFYVRNDGLNVLHDWLQDAALQKVGFVIIRQKGSHITLRRDAPKGRVTVPNHNPLKPGMLHRIIKDAALTVDEFIDLL